MSSLRKERDEEVHRLRLEMQSQETSLREGKSDLEGSSRRQRDEFEAELSAIKSERDSLEKRLLNVQEEVSASSFKAATTAKQVDDLSSQLVKVTTERTEARASLEAAVRTSNAHEQTVENLSSRLRILDAEIHQLRHTSSSELTSKDEAANSAKKAMEEEMESLRAALSSSRKSETIERGKVLEAIELKEKERRDFESKLSGMSLSLDQSRAELSSSRSHILELEELLSKSQASEKATRSESERHVSGLSTLNAEMETVKSLSAREKSALNDEISTAKRDAQRLNEEISSLQTQLTDQLSKQALTVRTLEGRLETESRALERKLEAEIEAKNRLEGQLAEKSNDLAALKQRFETSLGEISSLSSDSHKLTEKVASLSASLHTETSRAKSLVDDVRTEKERSAQLEHLLQQEREKVAHVDLALQQEKEKSAQLNHTLQQSRSELASETAKHEHSRNDAERVLKSTVEELELTLSTAKSRLEQVEQARSEAEERISTLQGRVNIAEEGVKEKAGTIKALSDEVNTLKKSLDRSSALSTNQAIEIEEALSDKAAVQEKLTQVEQLLATVKRENAAAIAALNAENAAALEAIKTESAAALVSTSEVLNKKLQVVVKEFKALRQARESDESARQLAVAAAADTRVACERLKTRLRASEDSVSEAIKAAKESSERCAMFEGELRQVRVSLRESQAAREFAEEKSSRAEREAADLKSKVEFDEKAKDVASVWNEVSVTEPAPRMTIEDPAVGLILSSLTSSGGSGTSDDARLQDLWGWFKGVSSEKDVGKVLKSKPKLELERVPFDVRANLLTLLVPLLKAKTHVDVKVYMRERQEVRSDIRLVVEDKRFIGDVKDAVNAGKTMAKEWRSNG